MRIYKRFAAWHQCVVRYALSFFFLLLAALPLKAQEQEKKLMDRIMKPNMDQKFDPGQHSVGGVRSFSASAARTKTFYFDDKSSQASKSFSAKTFSGSKGAWMGDFKFATNNARTDGAHVVPNLDKKVDLKTSATKDAVESNKTSATKDVYDGKRQFLGPESKKLKTPTTPDKENSWKGNLQQMSINDIRDLLNKSK